jgi:hypothetical protein
MANVLAFQLTIYTNWEQSKELVRAAGPNGGAGDVGICRSSQVLERMHSSIFARSFVHSTTDR